jgi:hypothetical protein
MNKITVIAVSTAALLGLGIASSAFANDLENNASPSQISREDRNNPLPWWWNGAASPQASQSYAYQPAETPRGTHKK